MCVRANAEAGVTYDKAMVNQRFDRYRNTCSLARQPKLSRSTITDSTPVFIVGMLRSGTTLVEQILDSHPEAAGGGELIGIPGAARALADYPDALEGLTTDDLNNIARKYLTTLRVHFCQGTICHGQDARQCRTPWFYMAAIPERARNPLPASSSGYRPVMFLSEFSNGE